MAPPGAERATPGAPSAVGPRLLQLYCCPESMACLRHSERSPCVSGIGDSMLHLNAGLRREGSRRQVAGALDGVWGCSCASPLGMGPVGSLQCAAASA